MGVGVPDEVMVALSERRISLLLDHQAGQLVQPGQAATAIMMSTVQSVSSSKLPFLARLQTVNPFSQMIT